MAKTNFSGKFENLPILPNQVRGARQTHDTLQGAFQHGCRRAIARRAIRYVCVRIMRPKIDSATVPYIMAAALGRTKLSGPRFALQPYDGQRRLARRKTSDLEVGGGSVSGRLCP